MWLRLQTFLILWQAITNCHSNSRVKRHFVGPQYTGEYVAVPNPTDILDKRDISPLYFPGQREVGLISGHDANLENIRQQISDLNVKTTVITGVGTVLGLIPKAGPAIKATISGLADYLCSASKLMELKMDVKIRLGIDKALVAYSLSNLNAEVHSVQSRLETLLNKDFTHLEKSRHVVPAIHSCQKLARLFSDQNYVMWKFKSIFAPFFLSFVSLYTTLAKISAELLPSEMDLLKKEMGFLLQTLNSYGDKVKAEMLSQLVVYEDETSFYRTMCPNITVTWVPKEEDFSPWKAKVSNWKSQGYSNTVSGCVLGTGNPDLKSKYVVPRFFAHNGPHVFSNLISSEFFCGFQNCFDNLKEIYSTNITRIFAEARSLFPSFTPVISESSTPDNGPECKRDSYGRLIKTGLSDKQMRRDVKFLYGCHKGYCWAYCLVPFSVLNDWCYTKAHSTKDYVTCKKQEECCPDWSCKGACWGY